MVQALELFLDDEADAAVRGLWRRLERAGVPSLATLSHGRHRPHVTFAVADEIPRQTRDALREHLRRLPFPNLSLRTLAAFSAAEAVLMLGVVVDTELLAVHTAVHDVLDGRVRQSSTYYLPGSWVPHCTLAQGIEPAEVAAGFAALYPLQPIKAVVGEIALVDTDTGESDTLLDRS